MTVRDEADVLPVNLAYHRSQGVDEFWIIDNGSADGTRELLHSMAATRSWLHWRSEPGAFHQSEFATGLAHEAHRAGAEWIIPIDADEFWWTPHQSIANALDVADVGAFVCGLHNFVQASRVIRDHPASLRSMTYRAESYGTVRDARRLVESGQIAFVEMVYPPKLVLRSSETLTIGAGNHAATGYEGPSRFTNDLMVLHAAIRSRVRLTFLAEAGRRAAAVNPDPGTSWHLRRWAAMEADGCLDDDWLANSHRRGVLGVGGHSRRLVRDDRLRRAVSPFISRTDRWLAPLRTVGSWRARHLAESDPSGYCDDLKKDVTLHHDRAIEAASFEGSVGR